MYPEAMFAKMGISCVAHAWVEGSSQSHAGLVLCVKTSEVDQYATHHPMARKHLAGSRVSAAGAGAGVDRRCSGCSCGLPSLW